MTNLDLDFCIKIYNESRAYYVGTIGSEKELIEALWEEVLRLRMWENED